MTGRAAAVFILGISLGVGCNRDRRGPSPARAPATPQKVVLDNGLAIEDLQLGNEGPVATPGKIVAIHYTGWLQDGTTVIDTTRNRQPLQFQLGEGTVLKGWDLGVAGMRMGGKRKLVVPPALAFGKRELGVIKPNSTLVFEVELVKVD